MPWKIITAADLKGIELLGKTIAREPEHEDVYEVRLLRVNGYVTAFHSNGKVELKMIPEEKLIEASWRVKK